MIHKKLVNFMNFIFCVFKVLQCIENLTKVWDKTKILVPLDGKVFNGRLKEGRKCPYLCHGSFIPIRVS